ncbi:hypothetical protein R3P38DRAFT_2756298 [Favolaschia claudopus]|uniref:Uncharacterized protein n=1 Tax=Favolaschia claudopus TaxID=2862362 RepID=A0AAW0EGR6_9AGAR
MFFGRQAFVTAARKPKPNFAEDHNNDQQQLWCRISPTPSLPPSSLLDDHHYDARHPPSPSTSSLLSAPLLLALLLKRCVFLSLSSSSLVTFVYEPHIAPKIEKWAEDFVARRRARKMKRSAAAAVSISVSPGDGGAEEVGGYADDKRSGAEASVYEMEDLVGEEVRQWRSQVHESIALGRDGGVGAGLRQRRRNTARSAGGVSALDESNIIIPYDTLTPHARPVRPNRRRAYSILAFPVADVLDIDAEQSRTDTCSAPQAQAPLTPDPSIRAISPPAKFSLSRSPSSSSSQQHAQDAPNPFLSSSTTPLPPLNYPSPHAVPSLSLAHPAAADAALDMELELVSAPASEAGMSEFGAASSVGMSDEARPESPFSEFSVGGSSAVSSSAGSDMGSLPTTFSPPVDASSLTFSPPGMEFAVLSASSSDAGDEEERWSHAGSESQPHDIRRSSRALAVAASERALACGFPVELTKIQRRLIDSSAFYWAHGATCM